MLILFQSGLGLSSEKVYFYHTDPAGTPLVMSDSTGTVVWRADYLPFGEESLGTQTVKNNKMFVGKEKDTESDLYYFGARYMDAGVGRFTSPDAIGAVNTVTGMVNVKMLLNPQFLNRYSYSLNNPYRFIDLDGLSPEDRAAWAVDQLNNKAVWKGSFFSRIFNTKTGWRCSEFAAAAHAFGDPDIASFPYDSSKISWWSKWVGTYGEIAPVVAQLADPNFMRAELAYLPISEVQTGDIVVWYGGKIHHSAIYVGEGNVVYQNKSEGVKKNSLKDVTTQFGVDPIVRRYIYPSNDN